MMVFDLENFEGMRVSGIELYKSLGEVYCPYFQEKVSFNAKGLEHLRFKNKNHARSREDQYIRFKLLHLAQKVLALSKTVQGISERKVFELKRSNQRNEYVLVHATYYEFIAVLEGVRVRIVIKEVGTAPKYFWSIIPHWKVDKASGKRKTHNGNPEED